MKKKNENLLVPQCLSNLVPMKRTAFTLAEVLITLGIIGVVATLTIPTLVRDYQKKIYVASFKKAHAELTEALKRMRAVERVETVTSTELYNARNDDSLWYGIFKKYMNISEFKKDITYSLSDGRFVRSITLNTNKSYTPKEIADAISSYIKLFDDCMKNYLSGKYTENDILLKLKSHTVKEVLI